MSTIAIAHAAESDDRDLGDRVARTAWDAHRAGLCVVPVALDGSKRPGVGTWRELQSRRPTLDELRRWFGPRDQDGLGLVLGEVSGNVEALDFDARDVLSAFLPFARAFGIGELIDRIARGYSEVTPKGAHWLYRCPEPGTRKLAQTPTRETLIETRSGFLVIAPSGGRTHPSGHGYTLASGSFDTIATLNADEHGELLQVARMFDAAPRRPAPSHKPSTRRARTDTDGLRPGDDFNRRVTWAEVLEPHGWRLVFERGGVGHWLRPGKQPGRGPFHWSATTNHNGSDRLSVFSSSTPFESVLETRTTYSKFAVVVLLEFDGDWQAATRALRERGFGGKGEG